MNQQELVAEIKRVGGLSHREHGEKYRDLKRQLYESQNGTEHEKIDGTIDIGTKYRRTISGDMVNALGPTHQKIMIRVDIYDVLKAFEITCPARQHALKKLLLAGGRGSKSERTDLEEAHNSIKRSIELL